MTAPASKPDPLRAGDGVVLRTPLLPMTALAAWTAAPDARRHLAALVEQPEVREALFVASPSLARAIGAWTAAPRSPAGQRAEPAIVKYVARMMGRATPFGLFSGVSVGRLGRETRLELAPRGAYGRRTRLDNDYLFVLIDELVKQPEVRARLRFRPNTSIYRYRGGGRLRYAGARLEGAARSYQLISVELTPYLEATLARAAAGATPPELSAPLADDEVTEAEARGYIDELIEAQVLVPELAVHVTGPEPIDGVIEQLRRAGLDEPRAILEDVRARLAALDAAGVGNPPARYHAIAGALERLPAKIDPARLFQIDLVKPADATLSTRVAAELARAIAPLSRIARARTSFDAWKAAFRERWEDRLVPLAEALDEESGLGFESARGPGTEGAPLLAGLPFPAAAPEGRARWGAFERHLLARLARALAAGEDELALGDDDLAAMELPDAPRLPDAFAALVRLAGDAREPELLLEGVSGPSGARLLARFCHASPELEALVRAHHAIEEAHRPDAVFAEIVHLSEGRVGNILCRPVLRAHELVYLGTSGAPEERQLRLDDLTVGVRGDRVVLWSARLGREVLPRLTTAHNFRPRSLPVYRFLCALAGQGVDSVAWSWGALGDAPFLPRVRIGRVLVARARWHLDARELEPITRAVRAAARQADRRADPRADPRADVLAAVAALRQARRLPRAFAIAAADNELPIDLDNPLLAAAFADEVSGARRVELTELFPAPDRLLVRGPEGAFAGELVLTFTRPPPAPAAAAPSPRVAPAAPAPGLAARRVFPPGSEWLFAKIYAGEATADRVLCEAIGPVARAALARGDASRWFFVRYHDPHPHVRVRFAGEPARLTGAVLPALEAALAPLFAEGAVRRLALDTYVRELERYGGARGIELIEQVFWRDSEAVLEILELLEGDAGAVARWRLAVRGIDSLLEAIGLPPEQRAQIARGGRDALGRELRADTALWARIGARFARERAELEVMFERDPARDAAHEYEPAFEVLARRDAALAELGAELGARDAAGELAPRLGELAWSLVHMHANRLLHASQRAQELVLYDFVRRLHAARKARGRR